MIHLVRMPWASTTHPSLALGTFQAQLAEAGEDSVVLDLNLDFATRVGLAAYEVLAHARGERTQVGEWLFAKEAWGREASVSEEEFLDLARRELRPLPGVADVHAFLLHLLHDVVPAFLHDAERQLEGAAVVAMTATFFQTVPSLALGKRLKAANPTVRLAYGGACFHDEMGEELLYKTPWIDAVCTGEGDAVVVPLLKALAEQRVDPSLPGVLWRHEDEIVGRATHLPASAEVLEALPDPLFDDFYARAEAMALDRDRGWRDRVYLPFETSRGCWWGQRQHCSFCGLNADGMGYRSRSGARVHRQLQTFARRYPSVRWQATDNILATSAYKDLLPLLSEHPIADRRPIFIALKANLNREQVQALAAAGMVYVQPGIESMANNLLKRMRKGVSALQNVYLLKICREAGVWPFWNNLVRIPGETPEDYALMERWFPRLVHLRPPAGGAPRVECHRFAPYFTNPKWTDGVRAMAWYAHLFPADTYDLQRVAYYFDARWKDVLGDGAYDGVVAATLAWVARWEQPVVPTLHVVGRDGADLIIEDTRKAARTWVLEGVEAEVLEAIDRPTGLARLVDRFGGSVGGVLDQLEGAGLVLCDDDSWVSLVLMQPPAPHPDVRQSFRALSEQREMVAARS